MRVIYRKIRHARYLYIKRNVEKVCSARYTLGARYLSKNTVLSYFPFSSLTTHLKKIQTSWIAILACSNLKVSPLGQYREQEVGSAHLKA